LLTIDVVAMTHRDPIKLAFRVRGSQWDHAFGVSLGRRGANPEARAEVLVSVPPKADSDKSNVFKYEECYFIEREVPANAPAYVIKLTELESQDERFGSVVSYLRGEYNRYICVPYFVSDYKFDYEPRVKSERRTHFFAAAYLIRRINEGKGQPEDELECKNYLKKAYFHGFATDQNFGDKENYDEKKLRYIFQFEKEVNEEQNELQLLRSTIGISKNIPVSLKDLVNDLWPLAKS
jgi:hypothetical protein